MDKEVKLAKDIIKKVREMMSPKFDYIIQFAPQVKFHESCDELWLDSIVFEADGNYQDAIIITASGAMLNLEDGPYQNLFETKSFNDILDLEPDKIDALRSDVEKCVKKAREYYLTRR